MSKQTKFSALIPHILSDFSGTEKAEDNAYFWHSFFLLKPEFLVLQNCLSSNYSIDALRKLISKCLEVISSTEKTSVATMRRTNASFLLVQIFESIWPRIRTGTFGIDAIAILCGLGKDKVFFDNLFISVLSQTDAEPALVLLSLLAATRDVQTNSLTDFFTEKCGEITQYCMTASDLHLVLFSLLMQIDRPSGPFIQHFRAIKQPVFNSVVANLIARCSQLYVCCRPRESSFFGKVTTKAPASAKLGLFVPTDFPLPMCFGLFEPFVDAAVLCFYELVGNSPDGSLLSAALALLSYVASSPGTPHSGDRLKMLLIAFEFLFDSTPEAVDLPFDHQQFKSCFNAGICECRECSIGAMALDVVSFLLTMKKGILPISHIIGRIIYTIITAFVQYRGSHNVAWRRLFDRVFGFFSKTHALECEYNGYMVATVAACSAYRAALFKKDDGYIHMLQALAKEPGICACVYRPPDAFTMSSEFMKKCKAHVQDLTDTALQEGFGDAQYAQVEAKLSSLKVESVPHEQFPELEKLSECPMYSEFFHIFARQHCEDVQAMLHYAISKL